MKRDDKNGIVNDPSGSIATSWHSSKRFRSDRRPTRSLSSS